MWKRLLAVLAVLAVLIFLLYYDQLREEPRKVSGFVEADEIRLGSRVGGRVAQVEARCQEGNRVRAGELLVSLEEFDLGARRAEAEAHLAAKQAERDRLKNGFRAEEVAQAKAKVDRLTALAKKLRDGPRAEEIQAARAKVGLATAQLDRARKTYDRLAPYFMAKGDDQTTRPVRREDFDRAEEELKVAEKNKEVYEQELQLLVKGTRAEDIAAATAELEEAREAYNLVRHGYRAEDIRQAEAAVQAAESALKAVEAQLRELQIVAPVSGVIEAVELQPGDLVSPGAPVLSLLDTSRLWVRAYVPEDCLQLKLNDEVTVTVDSFPGEEFRGRIGFISSQAEFTPNNVQTPEERSKQVFRIKVTLLEGLDKLRPGMPADVWLKR